MPHKSGSKKPYPSTPGHPSKMPVKITPKPPAKKPLPRLPKPTYQDSPLQRGVRKVQKELEGIPSVVRRGSETARGIAEKIKEGGRKVRRSMR